MNPAAASQIALDNALLSPCYPAFLVTAGIPEIYMLQFWNTVTKICSKLPDQPFDIPPSTDKEIVSFIYELGYTGNIETLPELVVDHMHQPWRTFAAGMYHCKNVDFVELLWEDFAFQIDNHLSKGSMPYPRFTKIIINHFISQNKSISMRNRINLHTARDDSLLGTLKYVSKTKERQVYGALIPKEMINEDILNSTAYQTYFAYASGVKDLMKARKFKKHASPKLKIVLVSPKEPTKKPAKGKKDVSQTRKPTTKPKLTKNNASVKADRGNGLNVLSTVALSKTVQLKKATKRSKKYFHISHASGSGDGTDFESGVPDEQQRKISGIDKGTGTKPRVLDVAKYDSESEKKSWGDSGEVEDDDEDDSEDESDDDMDDDDDNDVDDGNDDDGDDDDSDHERTESDRDEKPNLNQSNEEHEEDEEEEEYVDERVHTPKNDELTDEEDSANNAKEENEEEKDDDEELYRDVNVNLRKEDVEMTHADQGGADQHNVSQESGFEQVEEDAHVTLTAVHDTQKTKGPMQSSSVSSDFTDKLLNFENTSPSDNEIASLMDTTVHHEEPSSHTSSLFTVPIIVIPEIKSAFTTTIPPPPSSFNPLLQQATPTPTPTDSEATTSFPALPDFSSIFRFNKKVTNLEKDLNKQGEAIQQSIKSHITECKEEVLADKREYIDLIDTSVRAIIKEDVKTQLPQILPQAVLEFATPVIEQNVTESLEAAVLAKELYDALVKSYNTDKDLFETYGEVFTLKRNRDDKDKDQDPSAGPDRGTKRRKSSKDAESSRDPKSKESKSTSSSKCTSRSQHKSSGNNIARAEKPPTSFDELMDTPIDFSVFVMNRLNITNMTQELLVGPEFNLLKGTCKSRTELEYHFEECFKATSERLDWHNPEGKQYLFDLLTSLKIMKWYDYGHLDGIEVLREDQELYKFKEGDFPRLSLQDIEDMLLLLVNVMT
ncbi:hypothetical protein Tco_1328433 [Tanacetum coccineum]